MLRRVFNLSFFIPPFFPSWNRNSEGGFLPVWRNGNRNSTIVMVVALKDPKP